uniref:Uncharacterized protein n=1 Tax=Anguilla anguilla TaxID=7936 RepID=A0A0E9R5W5_ANGAN
MVSELPTSSSVKQLENQRSLDIFLRANEAPFYPDSLAQHLHVLTCSERLTECASV